MGIEFVLEKELASIGITVTEFATITGIINAEIGPGKFSELFNTMMGKMTHTYEVVTANLQPFVDLDTEDDFNARFDALVSWYSERYLLEISKARAYADDAYEDYVHLVCMREAKTGFPLLKRTFTRLAELTDKWITNDYWLAMCIDTVYKKLPRLLSEIAELKQKDPEDAYKIYRAAFSDLGTQLAWIRQQNARFHDLIRRSEYVDAHD